MSCKISFCLGPMEDFHTYIHKIHWIKDFYFPIIVNFIFQPCEFYEIIKKFDKISKNLWKFWNHELTSIVWIEITFPILVMWRG